MLYLSSLETPAVVKATALGATNYMINFNEYAKQRKYWDE